MIPAAIIDQAKETFNKLGLSALIAIGGDGSLSTALQLQESGIPMVGIPKTIDNDLEATAMTFGFGGRLCCRGFGPSPHDSNQPQARHGA